LADNFLSFFRERIKNKTAVKVVEVKQSTKRKAVAEEAPVDEESDDEIETEITVKKPKTVA
jgi:hypothetical protein